MPVGFPDYYGGLTLPVTVAEGGTGQTSLAVNGVLLGAGTSGVVVTAAGLANQVLQVPAGGGAPVFQALSLTTAALTYPATAPGYGIAVGTAPTGTNAAGVWIEVPLGSTINPLAVVDNTAAALFTVSPSGAVTAASLSLTIPLPLASGGTGQPSLQAANITQLVGSSDKTGLTGNVLQLTLYTPTVAGFYRATVAIYVTDLANVNDIVTPSILFTQNGTAFNQGVAGITVTSIAKAVSWGQVDFYSDANQGISYQVQATINSGSYDVHVRLEQLY